MTTLDCSAKRTLESGSEELQGLRESLLLRLTLNGVRSKLPSPTGRCEFIKEEASWCRDDDEERTRSLSSHLSHLSPHRNVTGIPMP